MIRRVAFVVVAVAVFGCAGVSAPASPSVSKAPIAHAAATKPSNTAIPTISGASKEGELLTAAKGTWNGTAPISYSYQWQRCNSAGASCAAITGASATTYRLTAADVGARPKVAVTAQNSAGSTVAASTAVAAVTTGPPVNIALPAVTGTAKDGKTLTTTNGTWTGTGTPGFTRQWLRCDVAGANCNLIAGATNTAYIVVSADVGSTLRARLVATNGVGSVAADSAKTSTVTAVIPSNEDPPIVTGTAQVGQTVTAQHGAWAGSTPITYSYQWQRCTVDDSTCTAIAGAVGTSYVVVTADVTNRIQVIVAAVNAGGTASATGTLQDPVEPPTPPSAQPAGMVYIGSNVPPNGTGALFRANEDGSDPQIVAYQQQPYGDRSLTALSPDGFELAWSNTVSCNSSGCVTHIWTQDLRTNVVALVATRSDYVARVRWSPDGNRLIFVGYGGGVGAIWMQDVLGGAAVQIPVATRHPDNASFAPNGRDVLYSDYIEPYHGAAFLTNLTGTLHKQITADTSTVLDPIMSPDGTRIAFTDDGGRYNANLSLINLDGTGLRVLDSNVGTSLSKAWSSDGQTIGYFKTPDPCCVNPGQYMTVPVGGGTPTPLPASVQVGLSASWRQAAVVDTEAYEFQPILRFDEGEKWRPLNISSLFSETNPLSGNPLHCVGVSRTSCTPLVGDGDALRQHPSDSSHLFLGDPTSVDGTPTGPASYRTPDQSCYVQPPAAEHPLQDCDTGSAASIYYNATLRSAGYNYFDYWFFYRFNEFALDDHEADWEHVVIARSLADPTTFDWVGFAQHTFVSTSNKPGSATIGAYLRGVLECDAGGANSCGTNASSPKGQRVWVYVAGGTHASYPASCTNLCTQSGAVAEGDHGGELPWGMNDTTSGLAPFPSPVGWSVPAQAQWTDWPGSWGSGGIASPGTKRDFKCPWVNNPDDATACAARRGQSDSPAAGAARCSQWYGGDVVAAACTPHDLRAAVHSGQVGQRGLRISVTPPGIRTASGRGIAQAVGTSLHGGETVRVRGRLDRGSEVMLRAEVSGRVRQWLVRDLPVGNDRSIDLHIPTTVRGSVRITS